jgi:hypothetical protein
MRSPSPLLWLLGLGLAGFLVGGLIGMFGYMGISALIHGDSPRAIGEFAAPYGLVGSLLGLILGGWGGFRLGKRLDRGKVSTRGESGVGEP